MGGFSDYGERKVLDHVFGKTTFTSPATMYVSWHNASPGDTGANEISTANYARKSYVNSTANWPAATGTAGIKQNAAAVTFVAATASWGTATHFGLWDAATAGNMIFWGTLATGKAIGVADVPKININGMTITLG